MSGKVTALEVQKKDKERVNVFIEGQFAFGLSILEAAHLQKGQYLSQAEIDHLKAKDDATRAFNRALRYLAPRPRSCDEIRQQLKKKETDSTIIDEVLERLKNLNYVNDHEFARYWIRNRGEFNPRGTRALRYELRQKGVDNLIIDEVLADLEPLELAKRAAEKKLRSLRGKDNQTIRTKLGGFLARRGFEYSIVRDVLDDLVQEDEPDDMEIYEE